ncbi:MAG: hypothetical protein M4D80_09720 [Myxococcota bacterium]|nr:hypothetical protein [Myxococcota bacterium]
MRATIISGLAAIAIVIVALTVELVRGPEFHRYADTRTWLGIPHAGDVLSNLAFLLVAARGLRHTYAPMGRAVCAGIAAIGVGSAGYHIAPSDLTLAFDWAPIALTLGMLSAAVIHDRGGPGRLAALVVPVFAIGSVTWWIVTGGTHGGNMAPYVAVQAACVALPPLVAVVAPGSVRTGWLLAALAGFALARLCGAYDRVLLDAIGISGHSLKHIAAAQAAACALRALMRR